MKRGEAVRVVDPEPFSVLVGAVGIVGGIASTLATYKLYASQSPSASREKALSLLGEASDELRYLEADLRIIGELLSEAEISGDRKFRPDAAAFLNEHQFWRYDKATDALFGRLRKLLKITHRMDALLPRLSDIRMAQAAAYIGDTRQRLHRLLRDSDRSVEGATDDIIEVVHRLNSLIQDLQHDLYR